MTFCTSRGSVATLYRWGGQIYNLLMCNSRGIPLTKNRINRMVLTSHWHRNQARNWNQRLFSFKICSLSLRLRRFGVRCVNMAWNIRFMDSYVLNKIAKFGAELFTHFWEIAIFVSGRFILTHPVQWRLSIHPHTYTTLCLNKKRTSAMFLHNFTKTSLIAIVFHTDKGPACISFVYIVYEVAQ